MDGMNGVAPERALALHGRLAGLRPIWPEDLPHLFDWFSDKQELPLWTSQFRNVATFQDFLPMLEAWLRDGITLLKVDLATGERFGFARAYNVNLTDGYLWLQLFVAPHYRLRPHVAESTVLFSRYLFEQFPIRKLCAEVFEFNEGVVRMSEKLGFRFEGRVKEHTWYRDRYWDHLFFSLHRDDWDAVAERFQFISGVEKELAAVLARGSVAGNGSDQEGGPARHRPSRLS